MFSITDTEGGSPNLTYFDLSQRTIQKMVDWIVLTKSRGPNDFSVAFFRKTSREIRKILNKLFDYIKRLGKFQIYGTRLQLRQITKRGIDERSVTTDQSLYWTSEAKSSKNASIKLSATT